MPISCYMRDLGFSNFEAPAAKCPAPKPTHIEHFFSLAAHRRGRGRGGEGGTDGAKRKGRGGWCGTASLRGGLARRRAFEKVARLTSSWRNWPALAF